MLAVKQLQYSLRYVSLFLDCDVPTYRHRSLKQTLDLEDSPVKGAPKKPRKGKAKVKSSATVSEDSDDYINASGTESSRDASDMDVDDILPDLAAGSSIPESKTILTTSVMQPALITTGSSLARTGKHLQRQHQSDNRSQTPFSRGHTACGLCGIHHGDKSCIMTNDSKNLAEYRYMLLVHADDEPLETRVR